MALESSTKLELQPLETLEPFVLALDAAAEEIRALIEPVIANEGCELIQIHVVRGARRTTMRIFIDTKDMGSNVGLGELESINPHFSAPLSRETLPPA